MEGGQARAFGLEIARRYNLTAEYLAKMWKATGADEPAAEMRATQGPSVFVYRFDWDEEPTMLGADLSVMLGAAHAFEIPFVFGHFDLGKQGNVIFTKANEASRKALATQMMSYWAEFAYTGSPGGGRSGRLPAWTPWDDGSPDSPKFLVFDTAAGGGVRMSSNAVTQSSVLAAVDSDPRLATQKDKCRIFRELADWSRGFTKKDYPTAGKQGCKEYPFDLSEVLFIATANQLDTIPGPLRDRMEIIALPGYTTREKLQIARRYLLPRQLQATGLSPEQVSLTDEALLAIIEDTGRSYPTMSFKTASAYDDPVCTGGNGDLGGANGAWASFLASSVTVSLAKAPSRA